MSNVLYRVVRLSTKTFQPHNNYWHETVLYCGYDKRCAFAMFAQYEHEDKFRGYGEPYVRVICEQSDIDGVDNPNSLYWHRVK